MKVKITANSNRQSRVYSAQDVEDTRMDDAVSNLKDDFDFVLDGLDKMVRDGNIEEALGIADNLNVALNQAIQDSASFISQ